MRAARDQAATRSVGRLAGVTSHYLWTSHSWGRNDPSHLHVYCYRPGQSSRSIKRYWVYPAGLQTIHLSASSDNLWSLTEFGPHEAGNNRLVFAHDRDHLKPSGGCP